WPSPLGAFLTRVAWLPVAPPRDRGAEVFTTPAGAWHFSEKAGELPPGFAPLIPPDLRRTLDSDAALRGALTRLGVRTWNDPKDAGALLLYLGSLVHDGEVADAFI